MIWVENRAAVEAAGDGRRLVVSGMGEGRLEGVGKSGGASGEVAVGKVVALGEAGASAQQGGWEGEEAA